MKHTFETSSEYFSIFDIGKFCTNEINSNIYFLSPLSDCFIHLYCPLLYTNMKYRFTPNYSLYKDDLEQLKNDYINRKNIQNSPEKIREFERNLHNICYYSRHFSDVSLKYQDLFDKNEFVMPLSYYKSSLKKDGYFILSYYLERNFTHSINIPYFTDFLNEDFCNFDTYFEFFTKYFLSFTDYFSKEDKNKIKANYFYSFNEIQTFAIKYRDILQKEIIKYQTFFRDFIDYTYNYTSDTDINTQNRIIDSKKRFFVFRKFNSPMADFLINNIKLSNVFDVEAYPYEVNSMTEKGTIIKELKKEESEIIFTPKISTTNIFSFFYYIFFLCIYKELFIIKKCKHCNKYFSTNFNSNKIYCDDKSEKNQSCKNAHTQQMQQNKQHTNLVYEKYRKIYARKAMLAKRNPDIKSYKNDYENWKMKSQKIRNNLKKGKITNQEFEEWLENNK